MSSEDKPNTLVGFISHIERYKEAFPELYRLGIIAISLPVSTASCERSFTALRQIRTWVRNSIFNEKLDSVAVLAIERERTQSLDIDRIIDVFAAARKKQAYSYVVRLLNCAISNIFFADCHVLVACCYFCIIFLSILCLRSYCICFICLDCSRQLDL